MVNILGSSGFTGLAIYEGIETVLQMEGAFIHLYGKKYTKPQRKMGHITILDDDFESLQEKVKNINATIKVIA